MENIKTKSVPQFITEQRGLTGHETPKASAYQLCREIVENSLDSAEQAKVSPEITLKAKKSGLYYEIFSADNGLGLNDNNIPKAFGTILTSSKYLNRQDRGMFGLGIKNVLLHAQITTGQPFTVVSSKMSFTGKFFPISKYIMRINLDTNQPVIVEHSTQVNRHRWHGLALKFKIGNVDFEEALKDILTYLKLTHAICPYATITFVLNDQKYNFEKKTNFMPNPPKEEAFHPYDIDFVQLESLVKNSKQMSFVKFLCKNFQRVGKTSAEDFCKFAKLDVNLDVTTLKHDERFVLKQKMNEYQSWGNPSSSSLSLITEQCFRSGVQELSTVDFFGYHMKRGVFSGSSFAVEVCCVVPKEKVKEKENSKKNGDNIVVRRFVNKIPLIEDYKSCLLRSVFDDINWNHYDIDTNTMKLIFYVHLASSSKRTLFKDLRKGIIADIPEIRKALDSCIKDVLRKVSSFSVNRERLESEKKRLDWFTRFVPSISGNLSVLTGEDKVYIEDLVKKVLIGEK